MDSPTPRAQTSAHGVSRIFSGSARVDPVITGILRLVVAVVAAAVLVQVTVSLWPVRLENLFGYFTIQSNVIAAASFVVGAVALLRGRPLLPTLRGVAVVCIGLTGVVYNTVLVGLDGGVALPWANTALHAVVPALALLDWVLVADRPPLRWSRLWWVVPYPLVWLAVVLVRGATDGWVPYPFLNPANGYGSVALASLGVTAAVLVLAVLVWALSRVRVLRPLGRTP